MPSKKLVIIVVAALLAVGIGFLVTYGYVHKGPDGYYDYDISYEKSFKSTQVSEEGEAITVSAPVGKMFVIVEIVLKNDSFSEGISTNPLILAWRLTLDHMSHEVNTAYTMMHPDFENMVLHEGRTWGYTVVFEVPEESVGKKDASVDFYYSSLGDKPYLEYDPELRLRTA